MAKTVRRKEASPVKHAGGYLPANTIPYEGAYVFFRPGYGLLRIAFGNGMNPPCDDDDEEDRFDENGNELDDYVYITTYCDKPIEDSWKPERVALPSQHPLDEPCQAGLLFKEHDGFCLTFSTKTHPDGDLRDFVCEACRCMGWPADVERKCWLVGTEGEFNWDGSPTRREEPEMYGPESEHDMVMDCLGYRRDDNEDA